MSSQAPTHSWKNRVHPGWQRAALGVCAVVVSLVAAEKACRADLVYFANGGKAQLPAEVNGDEVKLQTPDGWLTFQRDDFRKIVPGHWPEREWPDRQAQALKGTAQERYEAAWWALLNGLTDQAGAMLRSAHEADSRHEPTARLVAKLDQLQAIPPDPDVESLLKSLGGDFESARGPHVLVFHQHSRAEAEQRVALLEQVLTTYYLLLTAQGIDLPPPRHRLVSVWFAKRSDYLSCLHLEEADAFSTTNGYYHPTREVVLAFDLRSRVEQSNARAALDARRAELEKARAQLPARGLLRLSVGGAPSRTLNRKEALAVLDRLGREVLRQQLLLDLERWNVDLGTAAHEMVHQLVAHTGLAPRHHDFPSWLHEGFAAQFEVIRGGRWAGVGRAHDIRLADWRTIQPPPRLDPLVRDTGFGHGYKRDLYAQAWALVYYLRQEHPQQFVTFLDLLRAPDDLAPRDRTLRAFQAAFGSDLGTVETSWHRYMETLRTPLEAEDLRP